MAKELNLSKITRCVNGNMVRNLQFVDVPIKGNINVTKQIKGEIRMYVPLKDQYVWIITYWELDGKYGIEDAYDLLVKPLTPSPNQLTLL